MRTLIFFIGLLGLLSCEGLEGDDGLNPLPQSPPFVQADHHPQHHPGRSHHGPHHHHPHSQQLSREEQNSHNQEGRPEGGDAGPAMLEEEPETKPTIIGLGRSPFSRGGMMANKAEKEEVAEEKREKEEKLAAATVTPAVMEANENPEEEMENKLTPLEEQMEAERQNQANNVGYGNRGIVIDEAKGETVFEPQVPEAAATSPEAMATSPITPTPEQKQQQKYRTPFSFYPGLSMEAWAAYRDLIRFGRRLLSKAEVRHSQLKWAVASGVFKEFEEDLLSVETERDRYHQVALANLAGDALDMYKGLMSIENNDRLTQKKECDQFGELLGQIPDDIRRLVPLDTGYTSYEECMRPRLPISPPLGMLLLEELIAGSGSLSVPGRGREVLVDFVLTGHDGDQHDEDCGCDDLPPPPPRPSPEEGCGCDKCQGGQAPPQMDLGQALGVGTGGGCQGGAGGDPDVGCPQGLIRTNQPVL